MIEHHNFFKLHLPNREYKEESKEDLQEMLMEEFYLYSDGNMTPNFESNNKNGDPLAIILYPSFIYACHKLKKTENEKFHFINDCIDSEFVNFLIRITPVYKTMDFLEYHLAFYKGDKELFYRHLKYVILNIISKRINIENEDSSKYKEIFNVINDWLSMKIKEGNFKSSTKINKAKNIIINNESKISKQSFINNENKKEAKDWGKYLSVIISLIAVVLTIIIYWESILKFFK